jgi:tetratricopeptide (TPR) repeat protein
MRTSSSLLFLTGFVLVYFGLWHATYVTTPEYAAATSYVDSSEEISRLVGEDAARYGLPTGWIFRREGLAYFRVGVRGSRGAVKVRVDVLRVGDQWRVVGASYMGVSGSGELRSESRAALHASSTRVDAAYALLQRGQLDDALAELDRAIELDSLHIEAWLWRAAVYESMNRSDAAAADIRRALELNPAHPRARQALAVLGEAPGSADGTLAGCGSGQDAGCSPEVHR